MILTKHSRCFDKDTQGADGAPHLLQALSQSTQLEELDFAGCSQIPAAAWQQLPDGAWPKLRDANGIPKEELPRLQLKAEGAKRPTPSTSTLEIAAGDSMALAGPRRLKIAVARDLDSDVMDLMARLSSSPIEVLDLRFCRGIPAAAWQKLRSAKWLNLKKVDFCRCLAERHVGGFSCIFYVYLFVSVGCCPSSDLYRFVNLSYESKLTWMGFRWIVCLHLSLSQWFFNRSMLTKHSRCFDKDTQGADGAADLLEALSQSTQLEELIFRDCFQISAAAWQKLRGAKWLNLKKANFFQCLAERNG